MRNLKFGYLKLRNGNSERKKKFGDFIKLRVGDSSYVKENKQKKQKKNNNNQFLNKQKSNNIITREIK